MTLFRKRQPKGTPQGGRFSVTVHDEADVQLNALDCQSLPNGGIAWYLGGRLHCDSGPAVMMPNGYEEWDQHGQLHRDDGPAITYSDGRKEWYRHGVQIDPVSGERIKP